MGEIEPRLHDIAAGLAHQTEDLLGLAHLAARGKHAAYAVGCVQIVRVHLETTLKKKKEGRGGGARKQLDRKEKTKEHANVRNIKSIIGGYLVGIEIIAE